MNDAWDSVKESLSRTFLGVPLHRWVPFLALAAGLFLVLRAVWAVGLGRRRRTAERSVTSYDDYLVGVLARTRWFGQLGAAVFLALYGVDRNDGLATEATLRAIALVLLFLQLGWWGTGLIDDLLRRGFRAAGASESTVRSSAGVVRGFGLVFVWGIVFLLILSAFHIEITPLVAGLGVGGIAVAFALQQILSDVFCSVAIVLDRPFEVAYYVLSADYNRYMDIQQAINLALARQFRQLGIEMAYPSRTLYLDRSAAALFDGRGRPAGAAEVS